MMLPIDIDPRALSSTLQPGDVVFIRVRARPFREVAAATGSWTNHVGVVVAKSGANASVAESTFPLSRTTDFRRFVARSEQGRVAIARLRTPLTPRQRIRLSEAARRRSGIVYDTGFNLHSRGQFCSRFVREVLAEATEVHVGEVESFAHLLMRQPTASLGFWRLWYFGRIPWMRETVTPASLLRSPALQVFFDGNLDIECARDSHGATL
ncbi:YebB family permuted papain-like enzyme [Burkholderia diffusa]|uniref:YebB family permuted papain-like enzyme n=1 Tax=Burkholderia diffusa TaxID=488732 RepID=UPI0009BCF427|nr:YebB family permuted papain-like enzyme [Burkholderia diffusa]